MLMLNLGKPNKHKLVTFSKNIMLPSIGLNSGILSLKVRPLYKALAIGILYKWNYWRVEYFVICSNNIIGRILNWQISVLYGNTPI